MSFPLDLLASRYAELNPALRWFPSEDNVENADGQRYGVGFADELSWEHTAQDFASLAAGFREY